MAEKVLEKLKRLSVDLAESVRSEIDLKHSNLKLCEEISYIKKCITCYVSDKEDISSTKEAVSFIKGFYEAKNQKHKDQTMFDFTLKK